MAFGFGLSALLVVLISTGLWFPINLVAVGIGMICAIVAALAGDKGMTIASVVIGIVSLLILSPVSLVFLANQPVVALIVGGLLLSPIVAMIVRGKSPTTAATNGTAPSSATPPTSNSPRE